MEILSPAGSFEAATAAVRSGADAIYLGLKDFSARRNAENFDMPALKSAIEYCHIRGVKVYITLNTVIKQKELPAALDAAKCAYEYGADAFIVTDLGLISVLREAMPDACLHASTQMTVHSPAALQALKSFGIKRVVLSREMSRQQIREFCAAARLEGIEVEVFIHGALCMCVSGQCLMSSALGGRSGNRGLCAGPCRLEFSAKGTGRYDLSLKDLSLTKYLCELEEMGVASAKIEGRMKRPEYVAAATAACRAALSGKPDSRLDTALKSVFSRSGFTDGYYTGHTGADMFGIRTKEDADISSSAFSYLHSLYRNERQSVAVNIFASVKKDRKITVSFSDENGNISVAEGDIPEAAKSRETDRNAVAAALGRLGNTPYFAAETEIDIDSGLYISAAQLNALRREASERLSALRARNTDRLFKEYRFETEGVKKPRKTDIYAMFADISQIPDDLSGVAGVILPLEYDFDSIGQEIIKIARLPRYITDESGVQKRLIELKSAGVATAYCDTLSALALAKNAGFSAICSNFFNLMNSYSITAAKRIGADSVTLSAETYMPAAKTLYSDVPKGIFAYGRLPLMLTLNCPVKNVRSCAECKKKSVLTDRKGVKFPVLCSSGYSEVLNSTPLYLADKQDDLAAFDFITLSFTDENKQTARKVIDAYLAASPPPAGFTRGMYYNNIP